MPPLQASINKPSTVQKVLEISEAATREVGQEYTFVTFDHPVAKKAYHLVWQYPERYEKFVIHLGVFHTMLSYLGAIEKVVRCSGFEEIVFEAGLCATGPMEKILNGKHYNRSIRVHTIMTEALERLLFNYFIQCSGKQNQADALLEATLSLKNNHEHSESNNVLNSSSFNELFSEYEIFKDQVRNGNKGKTAQFWIQYMDRIWLLMNFSLATRQNNFDLHLSSYKSYVLFFSA